MIDAMANGMAQKLGYIVSAEDKVEIYAYAFKLVIMLLLNLAIVIMAAYLLGIVPTVLAFMTVFFPFRAFGGGVHLSALPRCIIVGSLIILGSGYFAAQTDISQMAVIILFLFTFLIICLGIVKWAPAGTKTNPITDSQIIRMQKRNLLFAAIIWTCIVPALIQGLHLSLALAMVTGAMAAVLLMSPGGFLLMEKVDGFFTILRKGGPGL
ncbi:MAG TPA: accessory gene regulator B family protein [Syntrophomonas sp.]|nr:accessory gene regulator B family protein [Syntrophomonas sp.]